MWLVGVPIFIILFAAISASLQRWGMFERGPTILVALCTTLLCMFALFGTPVPAGDTPEAPAGDGTIGLDFLLAPYGALALAILSMFLLGFVCKFLGRRQMKHLRPEKGKRQKSSPKPTERIDRFTPLRDRRISHPSKSPFNIKQSISSDRSELKLRHASTSKEISK